METCQIDGCANPVFVKSRGWCTRHYHRWYRTGDPLKASYDRGVGAARWRDKYVVEPSGCWRWIASLDKSGYGQFDFTVDGKRKNYRAHRFVYEQLVGVVPGDLSLDHLCRNRACVNPDHLEPVTHAENARRGESGKHNAIKTHCPQGHPFDEANTVLDDRGWRSCKECRLVQSRDRQRRYRERLRTKRAAG